MSFNVIQGLILKYFNVGIITKNSESNKKKNAFIFENSNKNVKTKKKIRLRHVNEDENGRLDQFYVLNVFLTLIILTISFELL